MFTTWETNTVLGSGRYRGTFDTIEEARNYARQQAARSRSFAAWEVCHGTPKSPGKHTGEVYRGQH